MTIEELNNKLTLYLKEYIKKNQHIDTGLLYRTVKFNCTYVKFNFEIKLVTQDYIVFLDEGTFLDSFYSLFKVQDAFIEFFEDKVIDSFLKLKF